MTEALREYPTPENELSLILDEFDSGSFSSSNYELSLTEQKLAPLKKIKLRRRCFVGALFLSDLIACLFAVWFGDISRGGMLHPHQIGLITVGAFPAYVLVAIQMGAYDPVIVARAGASIKRAATALVATAAIFFFALFISKLGASVSRLYVSQTLVICLVLGAAGRSAITALAKKSLKPATYANLCIYDDVPLGLNHNPGAIRACDWGLEPDISKPDAVARLGQLVAGMDRVIVHCSAEKRVAWSRLLKCVDIRSEIVMPELNDLIPLAISQRGGKVSLVLANGPLHWHQRFMKRLFDLGVAVCTLPIATPLMIVIAVLIKLDSPGPIFFRQQRIGLGNRRFQIWKFRTMRADRSDLDGHLSTTRRDQRVTRIGRILRRTSLDELPQLFNVLTGAMSIVGPRPHARGSRAEDALFWDIDHRYWHRHSIKPGITGLAQARGLRGTMNMRSELEQRLSADLEYVANWSLLSDIKIMLLTARALAHTNAY